MEEQLFVPTSGSGSASAVVAKIGTENRSTTSSATTTTTMPTTVEAVAVIQRAVYRFLVQKRARIDQMQHTDRISGASHPRVDMETLQQTCLRQSTEINQLKELVTKMLLESEEDRRKLRQRDREMEELMRQQQKNLVLASRFGHLAVGKAGVPLLATSSTVPSFNTFGIAGMDDTSSTTILSSAVTAESVASSALGVPADDLYDSNLSYTSNVGGPTAVHPLAMSSRSNSITSLQSTHQLHPNLTLKINPSQSFHQQQYQGLMDMVGSPSSSDFGSQHQEVDTPTSYGSGRSLVGRGSQHRYGSQSSFPMLNHRSSGSFSSASRGSVFDSPAVEQPGAYPWNVPATGLSHSQSWADDHGAMGHSAGFDSQYINQQYGHTNQQQTPQPTQQHQSLPPYRNNYRRHSEKPVHLDYQMCVDRILQATDQQASIHLQQKLKTSPPEQKLQIIDAILGMAYPLMSNRFGNFLIQRCFKFGSPQQIAALAQAMRGNILTLACDPFGCHIVQKAPDNVEEDCKARIVTEMFRRIRETIAHRYACHVWQKVFEIRWMDAPPAVMTLVVQNIFENCAEHDKRPVLNEILQSVTTIAKGQWGNWVIQHILEHGSPASRAAVTQKILEDAVNLSLDQYASKVVEKTLRMAATISTSSTSASLTAAASASTAAATSATTTAESATVTPTTPTPTPVGPPTVTVNGTTIHLTQEEVMAQYIHIVPNSTHQDRPRIPLIDIAADQDGNYIIQYILTNAGPQHRETCAVLIKRHMVSLRGSKYGQKVAFMVERWWE
ncbi:hypothetical protein BGX23_002334 [Mortierella sp. AD031]|nr:hypothetical protein BGX23_002334 [Mortierella sp. AD031]